VLNNWVNADDFALIARRIREGGLRRILGKVFGGRRSRVKTAWRKSEIPPTNWWDIPEVVERWNLKITGSPEKDFNQYVTESYLGDRTDLTAISLGCGTGVREIRWAETGKFKRIEGYDLSAPRIETARELAVSSGFSDVLQFEVADVFTTGTDKTYDAVIVEGALHHFSPLETILERIQHLLKDDGLLLVNEFVGPTRFQWTNRQLTEINQIIADLPDRLKTKWDGESIKKRVARPSRLRIQYGDPSEAIESGRIMPLLETMFSPVYIKAYGGTILHMLFHEIAHNFCSDDPEAKKWLQTCFDTEDALIESNILTSDFVAGVFRKKLS
jgi:ubiquinone/menaquinone biosynthesis C-methylase UbiE